MVSCITHSTAQEFREKLSAASQQLEKENEELRSKLEQAMAELDSLKHAAQELAKTEVSAPTL